MPDETGPSVVQHPLNNSRGLVFIAAIGFEHGALPFVGHGLRFPCVVGSVFGFSVAHFERMSEQIDVLELAAAGVKIPDIADGPKLVFWNKCFQLFERRYRRTRTGFSVETVGASSLGVQ